jgi:misacylated tRNA(Ala) deacylase
MAAAAVVLSPVTTPVDYHRIVSPRLTIPTDTTKPIPVGLLSCQRESTTTVIFSTLVIQALLLNQNLGDPLLHRIETSVVDVFPLQEGAPQKPPRKGAKVPRSEGAVLRIILHDTIIFPEGGGQPSDVGFISVGSDHTFEVFEAKRVGGHAVHSIRFPTPDELQKAQLLLPAGSNVVVTLGDDGHRRRLDHVCNRPSNFPTFYSFLCLDDASHISTSPFRGYRTASATSHTFLVAHRLSVPVLRPNTSCADPRRGDLNPRRGERPRF